MKRRDFLKMSAVLALSAAATACAGNTASAASVSAAPAASSEAASAAAASAAAAGSAPAASSEAPAGGRTLVAYYSATGNTEAVAAYIAQVTDADLFAVEPADPYDSDDLNYRDDASRVVREHGDPGLQDIELVTNTPDDWDEYDTVFVGYPLWWQEAAWPLNRFITENDFSGKRVIPFCTSASSGYGDSGALLAEMAGTGDWIEGRRFSTRASESEVEGWVAELGL